MQCFTYSVVRQFNLYIILHFKIFGKAFAKNQSKTSKNLQVHNFNQSILVTQCAVKIQSEYLRPE